MVQAAEFWNLDHAAERGRLDRSADRRIFVERQMRTALFVVLEIILQYPAQPGLMEDNDMIQALPSNRPDQPFNRGVLPRALGRSQEFVNAYPFGISRNFCPYAPSRSRSKYFGALSQGKASKSCRAVHSAVGLAVTAKCTGRRRSWSRITKANRS